MICFDNLSKRYPGGLDALKNINLTFSAWENASSTVKMNPKTSVRTCLPRHNSGLGHWSKIRPLLRIWFIIFFQFLKFVPKNAVLGLFFSFFGSQISSGQNYGLQPPSPLFYCPSPQKTDLCYQFLSNL